LEPANPSDFDEGMVDISCHRILQEAKNTKERALANAVRANQDAK
jgi:hypothetical protein